MRSLWVCGCGTVDRLVQASHALTPCVPLPARHSAVGEAASDYDGALRQTPKESWALYGRGMAKVKKGNSADGNADIAAVNAISSGVAENFAKFLKLK